VYARASGYAQIGPYATRPGFASAGEAMGGLRHLNGYPDQPPPRAGVSLGDSLALERADEATAAIELERDLRAAVFIGSAVIMARSRSTWRGSARAQPG
jgi:CoA-transferase family III